MSTSIDPWVAGWLRYLKGMPPGIWIIEGFGAMWVWPTSFYGIISEPWHDNDNEQRSK